MEEIYQFTNHNNISIKIDKYFSLVHSKHISSYGEENAVNIRDNIEETFRFCLKQINTPEKNKNILLVGKVQSGKTSNLELFTALAFDNGYNIVVIYGGYDNSLLNQTSKRFKSTFDIQDDIDYSKQTPVLFSSDDSATLLNLTNLNIEDFVDGKKPIFIISMKRPAAMKKVNALLESLKKNFIKAFIIDDEGDQASLNTELNKKEDASATYEQICIMKKLLSDPLYLSVTATPQANIFLNEYSQLRPDGIRLIEPGTGYCGAEKYHLTDTNSIIDNTIPSEDLDNIMDVIPKSLREAFYHYLISSAILSTRGIQDADMIIHTHRKRDEHATIYNHLYQLIENYKDNIENEQEEEINILFSELENYFKTNYKNLIEPIEFSNLKKPIKKIIMRIHLVLKNTDGEKTQGNETSQNYKIYIGGDLLQRGLTFKHLVTTYFLRWAKTGGNMDTNLQRARWFGYREKYIDLCRIFTLESIDEEFTNLAKMEEDLWNQFYQVQEGTKKIEDIWILAENTKQKPSRSNVIKTNKISFRQQWIIQKMGIFDSNLVRKNNFYFEQLVSKYTFYETRIGRKKQDKVTGHFSTISVSDFLEFIDKTENIFDLLPFDKKVLKSILSNYSEISFILMNKDECRKRTFYSNNEIKVLQQGADNINIEKANYLGDSKVLIEENSINIQVHKVTPIKKNDGENIYEELTQYMFAIYMPTVCNYYVKG